MNNSEASNSSLFHIQEHRVSTKIIKPMVQNCGINNNISAKKLFVENEFSDDPFLMSDTDYESTDNEIKKTEKNYLHESSLLPQSIPANTPSSNSESEYVVYRCQKLKSSYFGRKQFIFNLTNSRIDDEIIIYTAKFRPSGTNPIISIYKGNIGHLKEDKADGIILTSNKFTNFSLRKQSRYGNELMSLKFIKSTSCVKRPRSIQIYASVESDYNQNHPRPIFLRNIEPKKTVFGTWELNLNSKNVLASSKNCRIINDSTKETVFIIRKVEKHVIEIEAMKFFSLLQLFALSISSFLCQVK